MVVSSKSSQTKARTRSAIRSTQDLHQPKVAPRRIKENMTNDVPSIAHSTIAHRTRVAFFFHKTSVIDMKATELLSERCLVLILEIVTV